VREKQTTRLNVFDFKMTQQLQMVEDDYDSDELMWVKAGEPGEKPTIIRQIRSESSSSGSRDNSSGSSSCGGHVRRNLLTVENGTVYRNGAGTSEESLNALEKLARTSSSESRVIVVNVQEPIYPVHIDRQRIQKWKELNSPRTSKKDTTTTNSPKGKKASNNNNTIERSHFKHQPKISTTQRPLSQPTTTRPASNCSPQAERCSSVDPKNSPHSRVALVTKTRDEGYTSLTEDCKDSDTDSVRSKSLPSSWRPIKNQAEQESFKRYAQQMTSNNSTDCNYLYHEDDCRGDDDTNSKPDEKLLNQDEKDDKVKLNNNTKNSKRSRLRHNVENAIEICTCFVCLRSAVYHAEDEDDTDSLVDHPCSCDAPGAKCCGRWAVISLMVCFLPFLLCYPPLKSCLCIHDRRKELKQAKKEEKKEEKKNEKKHSKKKSKSTPSSSPKHKKDVK